MKKIITLLVTLGALSIAPAQARPMWYAPPCIEEDGSGQTVCIWDAKVRGNKQGSSLLIIDGRPVKIHHRQARIAVRQWRRISCVKMAPRRYACSNWNTI